MGRLKEGIDIIEKGFRNACEVNDKYGMGITQMLHFFRDAHLQDTGIDTIAHAQEAIKIFEEAEISVVLDAAWL